MKKKVYAGKISRGKLKFKVFIDYEGEIIWLEDPKGIRSNIGGGWDPSISKKQARKMGKVMLDSLTSEEDE